MRDAAMACVPKDLALRLFGKKQRKVTGWIPIEHPTAIAAAPRDFDQHPRKIRHREFLTAELAGLRSAVEPRIDAVLVHLLRQPAELSALLLAIEKVWTKRHRATQHLAWSQVRFGMGTLRFASGIADKRKPSGSGIYITFFGVRAMQAGSRGSRIGITDVHQSRTS